MRGDFETIRGETPDDDQLLSAVADRRRRLALSVLCEHGRVALADLADEVAVRERGQPLPEIPPEDVKRVYMMLYHAHVPKLADANLVRYDQDRDLVTLTADEERIESVI